MSIGAETDGRIAELRALQEWLLERDSFDSTLDSVAQRVQRRIEILEAEKELLPQSCGVRRRGAES